MSKKLLLLAGLADLPLVSLAQTEPTSTRFYIGVGANLLTNVPFTSAGAPRLVGPSVTGGVGLTSRLALQISGAYHWQNESYTSGAYTYGQGLIGNNTYSSRSKYFTIPVLLRYTFTPLTQRLQFDGLAGVTVVHSSYHYSYSTIDPSAGALYSYENTGGVTTGNITLGPAVRYALSSNVELTANGLVSAIVGGSYRDFGDRLFLNVLVGAQYKFGQR